MHLAGSLNNDKIYNVFTFLLKELTEQVYLANEEGNPVVKVGH